MPEKLACKQKIRHIFGLKLSVSIPIIMTQKLISESKITSKFFFLQNVKKSREKFDNFFFAHVSAGARPMPKAGLPKNMRQRPKKEWE